MINTITFILYGQSSLLVRKFIGVKNCCPSSCCVIVSTKDTRLYRWWHLQRWICWIVKKANHNANA